jgi:hypothetical protein
MSLSPKDPVAVLSPALETTLPVTPPGGKVKSLLADPRVAVVVAAVVRLWFCNRKLFSSWPSRDSLVNGLSLVAVVVAVVVLVVGGGKPVLVDGDGDETGGVIIRFGGLSN